MVTPLAATLTSQGEAALQGQVRTHEQLVHPMQCSPHVMVHPTVGDEATKVSVRVSVSCTTEVYNTEEVQSRATELLIRDAAMHLARAFVLQGEVQSTVSAVTDVDAWRGIVNLHVQADGIWAYQLSATQLHALTTLVAGKHMQVARAILLCLPGIHQFTIASTDWWDDPNHSNLPQAPNRIRFIVISWAGM